MALSRWTEGLEKVEAVVSRVEVLSSRLEIFDAAALEAADFNTDFDHSGELYNPQDENDNTQARFVTSQLRSVVSPEALVVSQAPPPVEQARCHVASALPSPPADCATSAWEIHERAVVTLVGLKDDAFNGKTGSVTEFLSNGRVGVLLSATGKVKALSPNFLLSATTLFCITSVVGNVVFR